jgi:hypothetical protein
MARNDVYLNINSLSPADAVVTGQQDMTAATIPELVLGDTPTFNFYFTDNTNVWPSWAGNAAYTLTWALSDAVAGDFAPAATTGNATPITGGWSVVLPLNSYDLVGLLNTKRVGQPYPVTNLWQQLRVTDPSGNEITRAMVWTPVRYRAISDTQNTESASPTGGRFVTVNNVNELTTPTDAQFYAANPVPTSALGTASNGQLFIGNGTGFTKATLTAGTGVTITNGSGSITIDATNAQELLTATVTNAEATPITKGQVVYIFGATGNRPSVKLAYNTGDATSAKTFGVVSDASIAAGGTGTVTCVGVVDGLNLGTYSDGDTVYLGATPGSITATKPYAPNHLVYVGIIERANAGNGELYVRIQNGYELDEIHDVQILTPPASGSLLIRDNTLSLWKAATLTAGTNIAVTNGDAAVTVGLTGTVAVANGGTGVTTSTGTGSVVLSTSPSLTTPSLGAASATSINGTSIPSSKTLVVTTDKLSALAATTSAELAGVITDETGSGALVFATSPSLTTPNIGAATATSINSTTIPSSKTLVVTTDKLSALAATTSSELAGVISDETGTGSLVFANTPTLVTPNIGAATGTSFNLTGSGTLGTTLVVNSTTDSSSKDTGAIVTEGGLGVEKSATIGGNLTVSGTGQVNGASGIAAWNIKETASAGTALSLTNRNSTQTWGIAVDAAAVDDKLLAFITGGSVALSLNATTLAATLAGNLTVSGTGTSSFAGRLFGINTNSPDDFGAAYSTLQVNAVSTGGGAYSVYKNVADSINFRVGADGQGVINVVSNHPLLFNTNNTERFRVTAGGNLLLGTTTDSGEKLQVRGDYIQQDWGSTGTNRGLIRLGKHTTFSNIASISLNGDTSDAGCAGLFGGGQDNTYLQAKSGGSVVIRTNGATTALTLDSSQNATFAGDVTISSAYPKIALTDTNSNSDFSLLNDNGRLAVYDETNSAYRITVGAGGGVKIGTTPEDVGANNLTVQGVLAIGNTVNTVSPTSPNRTITMVIGGTTYYIHAKTTND